MTQTLSPTLQLIHDLELTLGNSVVRVSGADQAALPLAIIYSDPLHRAQVEASITIVPPVKWYSVGGFAGYVSEDTRQSLQGPAPQIADVAQALRQRLSASLRPIYDLELVLGNTVVRVDEPAGSLCPLAVIFGSPVHRSEIEPTLPLPPAVRWWVSHDPHYPVEGGFKCDATGHVIAGPFR